MARSALNGFLAGADDLLRGTSEDQQPAWRNVPNLLAMVFVFGLSYGAVMGCFGGLRGDRALQVIYSALKVPLLLLVSFGLSLPSFFVLNTVLGVRPDFGRVLQALIATQAGLTIVLASLAPFTALWYTSFGDYSAALTFNALMFLLASLAGQWVLRRFYRPLIARNPRHRLLLRLWLALYAFVAIQMAWVLRPFVGQPDIPVSFFRRDAWGNAYVELARVVMRAAGF